MLRKRSQYGLRQCTDGHKYGKFYWRTVFILFRYHNYIGPFACAAPLLLNNQPSSLSYHSLICSISVMVLLFTLCIIRSSLSMTALLNFHTYTHMYIYYVILLQRSHLAIFSIIMKYHKITQKCTPIMMLCSF